MDAMEPRGYGAMFLLVMMGLLFVLCRWLARRVRRPGAVWGAGGYWMGLHGICLAGLLVSTRFEAGLTPLTLFTFPFSWSLSDYHYLPGFDTLPGLGWNYLRYVVCFGGLNTMLLAALLVLVVPIRLPERSR